MLVLSGVDIEIELGAETIQWINSQSNLQVIDILRMIELSQKFESKLKQMKYPILNLDSLLIKLLSMESTITISEIVQGKLKNIPENPFPKKEIVENEPTNLVNKKENDNPRF